VGSGNGGDAHAIALTGGAGITLNNTITAVAGNGSPAGLDGTLTLTATAGGVTQIGGILDLLTLILGGAGTFQLDQAGNTIANLTASVNGAITYRNAGGLTIANGVTSANNPIDISTVDGNLSVNNDITAADVDAGTSTLSLTAGSSANDRAITLNGGVQGTAVSP